MTDPAPAADTPAVVVLLVDDQPIIGEAVRRMLAPHADIAFHYCRDPREAIGKAIEVRPTVILQDLVMPEMDGLDLVRAYREREETKLVPLIVLSTKEEAETKAEAFARGANDYLVKLPDPVEVLARLRHHSRGYVAELDRNRAYAALAESEQALREELAKAAAYVRSLLPPPADAPVRTRWSFVPSASLGGDAFDTRWIDENRLGFGLLDVCGHGVGPALLSLSVLNVLRSREPHEACDPGATLAALNEAFPMSQHGNMFFTMWYGVYDRAAGRLDWANGGHPPPLLLRKDDPTPMELDGDGLIVGVAPGIVFERCSVPVAPGDRVYVVSDGIFEVQNPDTQRIWGFPEFCAEMVAAAGTEDPIATIIEKACAIQRTNAFTDDCSVLEITF